MRRQLVCPDLRRHSARGRARRTAQALAAQPADAGASGIEIDALDRNDRSLHRLLPVRLRRLDREEPDAGRSPVVRPLRRAAGAQLHDPAPHPRRRRDADRRSQEGRRLLRRVHGRGGDRERRASTPLAPDLATHRRARQSRRSAGARRAPARDRRAGVLPLRRADRSRATRRSAIAERRSGRPEPARSRLLPQDRRSARSSCADKYVAHVAAACFALAGAAAEQAAADASGRCCRSRPRWPQATLDRVTRRDPANTQHPMTHRRAAGADAELQLAQVRRRVGRAASSRRINVVGARLPQGAEPADRVDADGRPQGLPALAPAARRRPSCCRRRSPTPTSISSAARSPASRSSSRAGGAA